jgi:hypothetical protein
VGVLREELVRKQTVHDVGALRRVVLRTAV